MDFSNECDIAGLFYPLSCPIRIKIIELLKSGEYCVSAIADNLDIAQSKLSFHLKVLKDAELVSIRQQGKWNYYKIDQDKFHDLQSYVLSVLT